ncbi:hypothetical protein HGM15179_017144 [Zosterops borbonicus]|uniref:Uncharacterized protein n=1 Tax=Zosterops borbonicus TaxID=364589 RepID=A0A8K1G1C8_9PASS|nr:hypothetical protein HGM15179_017144 [Zosterops borbonicus]
MKLGLFSQEISNRTRRNGLKLHCQRFKVEIRKNFFMKHPNVPSREVVVSPSLKVFKKLLNVANSAIDEC